MKTRNLQIFICLVILSFVACQAWAADWKLYGASKIGVGYYDKNSVVKVNENMIRVLTKTLFNDVGKVQNYSALKKKGKAPGNPYILNYEIVSFEFDCLNAKIKVSSRRICDKRGNVLASDLASREKWNNAVPGSNLEKLKNEVCTTFNMTGIKKK